MQGAFPGLINRQGNLERKGLEAVSIGYMQFGLSGGEADSVGSQGITPKPFIPDRLFAIVDDVDGNKHAWTELDFTDIDNPVPMSNGRRGTIAVDSSSDSSSSDATEGVDDQPAYDFNGNSHNTGTIVYIERVRVDAWGIICCAGDSSSDGSFTFTIDCEAGTISVGDEDPQPPVEPPVDPGTGDDPTTNPKKQGGSGAIDTSTGDPGVP